MHNKASFAVGHFKEPGERLNHILDKIEFKEGRGRSTKLQDYLSSVEPSEFGDLKYTTIKSWFGNNSPTMKKIDLIINALHKDYGFNYNIEQIKSWWKVGGVYPFDELFSTNKPSVSEIQSKIKANEDKLDFLITSLVVEESRSLIDDLDGSQLCAIKDKAMEFARNFSDPYKTQCSDVYLRAIIKNEIVQYKKD